jgi:predicted ribosomally synthesized peptide with SipW-like signal peptide
MKKLFIVLLGITIVLSVLTSGTLAYFTANSISENNVIATGKMTLNTSPDPFIRLTGIMPGSEPQESMVNVFTNSPVRFFYKIKSGRQTGTSTKLWEALMVEAKDSVTGEMWSGPLSDMDTGWFARQNGVSGGGSANGRPINFKVWLPQNADVDDETTATVKFEFDAEQWRPIQ